MKLSLVLLLICTMRVFAQFSSIELQSAITGVQPMTGIVIWDDNPANRTDAISLEYSYMLYNDVVAEQDVYDWTVVENLLDDIASRNHQAILRFRFVYPGYETSVPDYIKALGDYHETQGQSEGEATSFCDWTHPELQRFTLEFYTNFAARYDHDPRIAFLQSGFGLWAEYHIYDGPFILGTTFPSKAFQEAFFRHLDTTFTELYWSVSIDAADDTYSPLSAVPALLDIDFGLFDDSFMNEDHGGYNTDCWNFLDRSRYLRAPAGGEFSYYTNFDQQHVLDLAGIHGMTFEGSAADFHISYMIGSDQPDYQTMTRIKEASMACGYRFTVNSFLASADSSIVEVENTGVAPIYYDAFAAVNGVRADESLKHLGPGEVRTCHVGAGGGAPVLTIESDRLVNGQVIEFEADLSGASVNRVITNRKGLPVHVKNRCSISGKNLRENPVYHELAPGIVIENGKKLLAK